MPIYFLEIFFFFFFSLKIEIITGCVSWGWVSDLYLSSDWYVSQAFIPNVISTVHDDTYSLQTLHSVSFPKNDEVLISDCRSPPAPTWGVEPKVTTPDKSFPSCSSRLPSRIWICTETKYTEFFLSISSDWETWNLGSERRVLTIWLCQNTLHWESFSYILMLAVCGMYWEWGGL